MSEEEIKEEVVAADDLSEGDVPSEVGEVPAEAGSEAEEVVA